VETTEEEGRVTGGDEAAWEEEEAEEVMGSGVRCDEEESIDDAVVYV